MSIGSKTLGEVGELRLIEEVILPLARQYDPTSDVGDDCAYFPVRDFLAVTADVGPKPLLHSLPGYEDDYGAAGWLAVVATASDVATAGATPLFLTNCIDAPPELTVNSFTAFMRGYFEASSSFGFRNGGGDVRHGPKLSIRVFGTGIVDHGKKIGRGGTDAGDQLVIVGPPGRFMATYLLAEGRDSRAVSGQKLFGSAEELLRRPAPQIREMMSLAGEHLIVAASDTSDGLLGAIDNLARSSGCGFQLDLNDAMLPECVRAAASVQGIDAWNIFFAWGDWAVAATIRDNRFEAFKRTCVEHNILYTHLGRATNARQTIVAHLNGSAPRRMKVLRNENFVSYGFNAGLKGHLDYILRTPLF